MLLLYYESLTVRATLKYRANTRAENVRKRTTERCPFNNDCAELSWKDNEVSSLQNGQNDQGFPSVEFFLSSLMAQAVSKMTTSEFNRLKGAAETIFTHGLATAASRAYPYSDCDGEDTLCRYLSSVQAQEMNAGILQCVLKVV